MASVKVVPSRKSTNNVTSNKSVLVLSSSELNKIKAHMQWAHKGIEEAEKEKAKKDKMKAISKALAEEWPNPLKIAEEKKLEQRKEAEEAKEKHYLEILKDKAEERKKYLKECKKKLFFNNDTIKTLHGALLLSEVLRERDAQVKFNKQLKEDEAQRETVYAVKIKEDAELLHREKLDEIAKKICKCRKYKMEIKQQIEENEQRREEDQIGEKEELKAIIRDVKIAEAKHKEQVLKKKNDTRKFYKDALEQDRQVKEKLRKDEEDEERLMEICAAVRQKMARLGRDSIKVLKDEVVKRRILLAEIVATTQDSILAAEQECLNRAIVEKEARAEEAREKEAAYRRRLVEEIKAARKDLLDREQEFKRKAEEIKKWNLIQRYKQDEMNRIAEQDEKKNHRETCQSVRRNYDEQMVEFNNEIERQKQEELDNLRKIKEKWNAEDKEFLTYSKHVIEESREKKRNLIPLERVVKAYKKKNQLVSIQRDDPLQRSRVPFGPRYTFEPEQKTFLKDESMV
ncbi:protein CFAP210 [Schistocerca gregaria]|uniref:protein CFAP210 n=1 Tax=Schistocerca gregaria TaxID=7010 RepID=UPI00211ECA85|nr:protein CFAP210 [Schistocerca gregaria]